MFREKINHKVNQHKKAIVVLLSLLMISSIVLSSFLSSNATMLSGWSYRKLFYLNGATLETDFQVSLTVYNSSDTGFFNIYNQTQVDFEDLRITENNGITQVPIWNQSTFNSKNCTLWAKFPSTNTTYYLYWGNNEASAVWNQEAVFIDVVDGVVLGLPMNEGSGSIVKDYSGNSNDGTFGVAGASPSWTSTGKFGTDVTFDGGDIISFVSGVDLGENWTVLLWLKVNEFQALRSTVFRGIGAGGTEVTIRVSAVANSRLEIVTIDSATSRIDAIGTDIISGVQQIALSRSAIDNKLNLYVDDSLDDENGDGRVGSFALTSIGLAPVQGGFSQLKGCVAPFIIFDSALLTSQITETLLNNYPDVTLEEGSSLVRKWVDVMPVVSFGSEVSRDYASRGEFLAAALIASIICVPLLLLVIWGVKKRS